MNAYTMKKDEVFGDEMYRGEYGAAKVVKNNADVGGWTTYFFDPGQLKADEKISHKTRKACREWAIAWVSRGWF